MSAIICQLHFSCAPAETHHFYPSPAATTISILAACLLVLILRERGKKEVSSSETLVSVLHGTKSVKR